MDFDAIIDNPLPVIAEGVGNMIHNSTPPAALTKGVGSSIYSSILDSIRNFELPTGKDEWRSLLVSAGAGTWAGIVRSGAMLVAMLRSTEMSHFAIALLIILYLTTSVWSKFTGALLGKWFRDPLKEKVGMTYGSIKISVFRMSLSMTGLELRPSESALAKTIVVAIYPSADVKTPRPAGKDGDRGTAEDEEEEGRWGKLKERLLDLQSPRANGGGGGEGEASSPDPFVGSSVKVKDTALRFSLRMVRVEPLTELAKRRRKKKKKKKMSAMQGEDVSGGIDGTGEDGKGLEGDDIDLEGGSGTGTGKAPHASASATSGVRSWYTYAAIYIPAPRIVVKMQGLSIEVDKSYLAPEPPAEFLPSQEDVAASLHIRDSFSLLGGGYDESLPGDAYSPERLPAAIAPPDLYPRDEANPISPGLATFEQNAVLQNLANSGASNADTITFYIERFLEHSRRKSRQSKGHKRKGHKKEGQKEGESDAEPTTVKEVNAADDANDGDSDTLNLVFQELFRVALSSVEIICTDTRLIIAGADADTVRKARQDHPEPFHANLSLAQTSWDQRALTVIDLRHASLSFEGTDYNAHLVLGGVSLQVGLPAIPSSPGSKWSAMKKGLAKGKKGKTKERTWHDVIPSHEIKVEISGVLSYLTWSVNYDHHWATRKLGATITASSMPFTLNPTPLFTALLHLDDFSDPNSPYNEWKTWLSKRRVVSTALSDEERRLYRNCYRRIKGVKEEGKLKNPKKKTHPRKKAKQGSPEEVKEEVTGEEKGSSPSQPAAQSGSKGESLPSDETTIDSLEKRMSSEEIMKERCTVMKRKWTLTGDDDAELKDFLSLTNSRILSKKRSRGPVAFDEDKPMEVEPSSTPQGLSPFERVYASPVEAVMSLVQEKFHLMVPQISCSLCIETIRLQLVDAGSGVSKHNESNTESKPGKSTRFFKEPSQLSTTLAIAGFVLNLHQQNVIFSRSSEEENGSDSFAEDKNPASPSNSVRTKTKLRTFQRISVKVQRALWLLDENTAEGRELPEFFHGDYVGLLYKHPHNALGPIVSLSLEHDLAPIQSQESYFRIGFDVGNFLFIINPIPLSSSLKALTALGGLPFRDLATEEKMRERIAMLDDASDSSRQLSHYHVSEEDVDSEVPKALPDGVLLGGMHVSLAVKVLDVSILLLTDATSLHRGTIGMNIPELSLAVESKAGFERADLSISPLTSHICRVLLATNDLGGRLNVVLLPFKPVLEFDGALITYSAKILRDDSNMASLSPHRTTTPTARTAVRTFGIELTALVPRIAANSSPTINAMLAGSLECLTLILEGLSATDEIDEPPSIENETDDTDKQREALRELWNVADVDGSNTLSRKEVEAIIVHLFNSNSIDAMSEELPKAQQLTDAELQREIRHFLSLLGSTTASRDVSFPEMDIIMFKKQHHVNDAGLDMQIGTSGDIGQCHDFISSDSLRGLIYYDDLREYASTFQVYRMTGVNDPHKFPPPSLWRKGEGIGLFWDVYEKETGCLKASLNGQKIDDVQRKLVRALNNFDFAKYCWKSLVGPALLQGQEKYLTNSPRNKRLARVTDWVLDRDTKAKNQIGALDRIAFHVEQLQSFMEHDRHRRQNIHENVFVQYDIKLLLDVDEVSVKVGNGLALAAPLLDVMVSRVNVSANALLQPSDQGELFVPQPAASSKNPMRVEETKVGNNLVPWTERKESTESLDDHLRNNLHFEFVTMVNGMNAKHDKMEDLIEPFSTFGKVSYSSTESVGGSGSKESQPDTPTSAVESYSLRFVLPKFANINVSPSSIETFTFLKSIALQSSPELFDAMTLDQQVDCIQDLWDYCGKRITEELDVEDLKEVMHHFLWFFQDGEGMQANEKMDALTNAVIELADADESGTVSFAEIEHQIRADKFMFSPAKIRIHNHLGTTVKYCSRSFMERAADRNPSITASALIATFDSCRDNNLRAMHLDMSSSEAAKMDGLILAVPNCKIIEVPVLTYQSLMVHLKNIKLARKRFSRGNKRNYRSQASASGFEPYLTLAPIANELDSITINVRSSLVIEAQTPIDIRVVRVTSLDALYGRKSREGGHRVNFAKKNLSKAMEQIVANSPIVFERFGLESGSWVGLPISIMLSSSHHFLIIGDLTKEKEQLWRPPVLLTKDFLFNTMHIGEVTRTHALSGIAVQRNRLNVHQSRKSRRTKSSVKQKTAWDTTIRVMPSFVLTNALPFNIQYRCWQKPPKTDDWKAEVLTGTPETRDTWFEEGTDEDFASPEMRRSARTHVKTDQGRRVYAVMDHLSTGGNALLNGLDMGERLYIQIAQDYVSTQDIDGLVWTAPLSIELDRLRAGGNKKGSATLPPIKGTVGDDADFFIDVTVERSGVPYCTLFSPFWITNKTGMKLLFKFTGREELMQDSGAGGLPLMAMCHVSKEKVGSEKQEVSILPLEGASSGCAHTWWDRSTNGELSLNNPPLKNKGKSLVGWSEAVGLEAVGTLGQISCHELLFGVSVETLTGVFYKTNHISFAPRYIAKNVMHIPTTLFPVYGHLGDVQKLTYNLTRKGLSAVFREREYRQDAYLTLQPNQSTILYHFQNLSTFRADADKDRYICMRIDAVTWNYSEMWHIIPADVFGSSYYMERDGVRDTPSGIIKVDCQLTGPTILASIMISPRSPFRIENRSTSQYLQFVQDDPRGVVIELPPLSFCAYSWDNPFGKRRLRAVVVPEHKSKEYLMDRALGAISPTNSSMNDDSSDHSANETMTTMGIDDDADNDADIPRKHGKTLGQETPDFDPYNTTSEGTSFIKRKRLHSLRSRSYALTQLGAHKGLPCPSPEESTSFFEETKSEMCVEVRILSGSRVLSFNDSNWRMQQSELGLRHSGETWKNINFDFFALGVSLALVDDFPHEIMNITLRHFTVQKRRGTIETAIRLRHVQIDAMFSSARYPIILEPKPLGVDRRDNLIESQLLLYYTKIAHDGSSDISVKDQYWMENSDWPVPVFETTFSYLPQSHMTWIPDLKIFVCPMSCQIELDYLLRIADLIVDSLPDAEQHEVTRDTMKTLQEMDDKLEYPTRNKVDASLTYIENLTITPTYVDAELDVRAEEQNENANEDDMAGDSMLALSSLGKQTSSNLSAGLLAWVNSVAAKFAHVSPTFKYKELIRVDTYCNAEDLLYEIMQAYITQTIYQSYKVVFSMQLLGDPTELLDHYKTGITDLANVTTGSEEVGKGLTSAVKNVFGGTLDFGGKLTGEFSDLLDSLATNELTSKELKPKKNTDQEAPSNIGDGVIQGTTFLGQTLVHGVAGVVGNPYRGLKKGSAGAVAKGVASGVSGLVVAPFVGALGFTAKVLEGTSNTTSLFEVNVIESRCRPARIVSWGTNIGQTMMPYIKGIGIRVHTVRYQKKWKGVQPTVQTDEVGTETSRENAYPQTAKEFRKAKANEEKRRNPAKKVVSVMRLKDKTHILTSAAKPRLIVDDSQGSDSVSRYFVVFEETLLLRCSNLQLSDTLAVYLWQSRAIAATSRAKPISLCKFTVGDIYSSMHKSYKEQMKQRELSLTQHSSGTMRAANIKAGESVGNAKEQPKPRDVCVNVGIAPKQNTNATHSAGSDNMFHTPLPKRMQVNMAQMRRKGGNLNESTSKLNGGDGDWVTPAIQEFPMMKPVPKKSQSRHANVISAVQEEMASIKRVEERLMAFFESDSEASGSDSSFQMDDRVRASKDDDEDAAVIEQLHGHAMLSFYPILW